MPRRRSKNNIFKNNDTSHYDINPEDIEKKE